MAVQVSAFERFGIRITPAELDALLREAVERMLPVAAPAEPRRDLTPAEAAALQRGGLSLEPVRLGGDDPLARSAAEYAALLATALNVPQAAQRLDVDGSRIRQRLAERTLYGIKLSAGWRLPAFQFDDAGALPGLERVLPRLDRALHPLAVARWFGLPNPDLVPGTEAAPLSPRDWLRLGGDPSVLAELADTLGRA